VVWLGAGSLRLTSKAETPVLCGRKAGLMEVRGHLPLVSTTGRREVKVQDKSRASHEASQHPGEQHPWRRP
jgi:hypothetical protein